MKNQILAGVFSTITIFTLGLLGDWTGYPFLIAPFGASCVLLFGFTESPFVKIRNLIGGHIVTAATGLFFLHFTLGSLLMIAPAVGIAVFLMLVTKTAHPEAGANPILTMLTHATWSFLIFPISSGVIVLLVLGLFHRGARKSLHLWLAKPS